MTVPHVHVYVPLERDEDGYPPFDVEEIDAVRLSEGVYRIDVAPASTYGVAPGDVVRAVRVPDDDRLWVLEVVLPSDHWVARVKPRAGVDIVDVVQRFESLGCRAHESHYGLVAIDVPPEAAAATVLKVLQDGQDKLDSWYFDLGVSPDA